MDPEQIDQLCKGFNLLEYVSSDHEMKNINGIYFTRCDLHIDKTPSLAIYEDSNSYYCFSCKCGGNPINYLRQYEGLSFQDALIKISKITGREIRKSSQGIIALKKLKRKQVHNNKCPVLREVLNYNQYCQDYQDIAPQEWLDEGISKEAMEVYEVRIDPRANRIVYPVYDSMLNMIGVKGRTRFKNYEAMGLAKYMNYNKIGTLDYLTGMKQAQNAIKEQDEIIIFEGIKSCMKAWDYGYYNTVSAETSTLNEAQIRLILEMKIRNVVIAFDSDQKVIHGVHMLKQMTNVYVVRDNDHLLKDKMSPVDAGKEVWEKLYNNMVKI